MTFKWYDILRWCHQLPAVPEIMFTVVTMATTIKNGSVVNQPSGGCCNLKFGESV